MMGKAIQSFFIPLSEMPNAAMSARGVIVHTPDAPFHT